MTNFDDYRELANRLLQFLERARYRAFNRSLVCFGHLPADEHVAIADAFQQIFEGSLDSMGRFEKDSDAAYLTESHEPQRSGF